MLLSTLENLSEAMLDALEASFRFVSDDKPIFRIQFNGRFVRMHSGKTAWNGRGPAMNALHWHMDLAFPSLNREERHRVTRFLIDEDIIRIVIEGAQQQT